MNIISKLIGSKNKEEPKKNIPTVDDQVEVKLIVEPSKKSNNQQNISNNYFLSANLLYDGWSELLAYAALLYYRQCAPLFTAINLIADEFATMEPYVYDTKAKKYIDHDVLELLNHPFGDFTWVEFAKEFASYFIVTGNNYTIATGRYKTPPLELINMFPGGVSILPSTQDGYAGTFIVTSPYCSENFNRDESTGYFRFVNALGTRELWQTKSFNPCNRAGLGNYGMSVLTPIYYEINQHLQSSKHNLSLLSNGARLSIAFTTDKNLTDDSYKRLKQEIVDCYSGANNAGKVSLLDGGIKADEMGMSNKDMDFMSLKKEVTERIYNALKVPVALMSVDRATMNNMDKSILMLYDLAVIPLARRIFKELTIFLMPRYKNSENLVITFRKNEIPALQERELANVKEKQGLGIYSVNELRAMLGDDPRPDGNEIMVPSMNASLSSLVMDDKADNADSVADAPDAQDEGEPVVDPPEEKEEENAAKSYFNSIKSLTYADGAKLFDKKQLDGFKKHYVAS